MVLLSTIACRLIRARSLVVASFAADGTCNWGQTYFVCEVVSFLAVLVVVLVPAVPLSRHHFQLFPNRPGRHFLEGALHKLKCVVGVYQVHKNIGELFFFPFSEDCTCVATGVQKVLPDTTTAPLEVWLHNVMRSCPPFPVTGYTSSESSTTNDGSTSLKSPHQPPTQAQSSMQLHPTFF